jgi:hypothetical protein
MSANGRRDLILRLKVNRLFIDLLIHSRIYGLHNNLVSRTGFVAWKVESLENNKLEMKWPWSVWKQYPDIPLGGLRKNTRSFS